MKRLLRILHIFGSSYAGHWAFYPLTLLAQMGHTVGAVCPEGGPLVERLRQASIPVSIIPFPRHLRNSRAGWQCIRALRNLFREQQTQVVHCHLVPANLYGRIAAWMARVPVRITQWPGPMPLEAPIARWLDLSTAWMDCAIVASSTATLRIYERYGWTRNKLELIYYGFPTCQFDLAIEGRTVRQEFGIGPSEQVVALIAYMDPPPREPRFGGISNKGHEILIQAARQVCDSRQGIRFLIVGDSLYPHGADAFKAYLKELVQRLDLGDAVIFTGHRSDIPEILAACDVVAIPSQSENVGGAVEPLLMEKPVVASNVGGLPDVVLDGKTGLLVPPRDPQALAQALLKILALTSEQRQAMGKYGRQIVQSLFELDKTVALTEDLYYRLLDRHLERA